MSLFVGVDVKCDCVDFFFFSYVLVWCRRRVDGEWGFFGIEYCLGGYKRVEKVRVLS